MQSASRPEGRFRLILDRLLRSQAYRELGAARLFEEAAPLVAPRFRRVIAWHAQEERSHYLAVTALWTQLARAPQAEIDAWVAQRLARDPLPTPATWLELAMAQFLFDRAGQWQLREYEACRFTPYRDVVAQILDDERGHQELGAQLVVALCRTGEHDATKDVLFARWLAPSLKSFGRPGSPGNREAIALGIKRRDSAAVMQDFVDDIKPAVRDAGLRFPPAETLGLELPATLSWG